MAAPGSILLASQLIKNKKKENCFRVRPTSKKRKIYDGDELLVDLQNDDVRLNGEPQLRFKNSF